MVVVELAAQQHSGFPPDSQNTTGFLPDTLLGFFLVLLLLNVFNRSCWKTSESQSLALKSSRVTLESLRLPSSLKAQVQPVS